MLHVCGVDEAGRGPLCGEVFTAAVILDPAQPIADLNDSKKLSAKRREALAVEIKEKALAWCVNSATLEEIERLNILYATMLSMKRAVEGLAIPASKALVDGNRRPDLTIPCEAIVKGDATVPAISAASILAKVARDHSMIALDQEFPQYQFLKHKGYGTALHLQLLKKFGPSPAHRRTFEPIASMLAPAHD